MHQVAEFVEERDHITVLHQAWIVGCGSGKVADQNGFR